VGLILSVALVAVGMPSPAAGLPSAATFSVALTATPSEGPAPLLVAFDASVSAGTATAINWTFGDGSYANLTGSGGLTPAHIYDLAGVYDARVQVWEGATSQNASVEVSALGNLLGVVVVDTPSNGSAPLRVQFYGVVTGGTGTYLDMNWSFGDGAMAAGANVTHTFANPGIYIVTLSAVDTVGHRGTGSASVDVAAPPTPAASPILSGVWYYGIPAGLALVAVGAILLVRGRRPPGPPPAGVYGGFDAAEAVGDEQPTPPRPSTSSEGPSVSITEAPPAASATMGEAPAPAPPRADARQATREVVEFLYRLGRVDPDDIPTTDWTQARMGERLGIPQNVLSNVLRRLEAAGIVATRVEHVHARPRRVKTYYLTVTGERLARSRLRRDPPARPRAGP
jgi:hypothetical protein